MCCIFTCCGWMIDLIQRLWTFTMSCCISSAVCCSLLTASMSGIALGYNYSLAEYIDLKETNVSVYLKRGVFDDDIADDMEWRRSGHLPISGQIKEDNLMTGASADEATTLRSARRLDDSIYESNDRFNFEGSLMKLTAKSPGTSSTPSSFEPLPLHEIVEKHPGSSLDQLKAVQGVLNMRKMAAAATRTTRKDTTQTPYIDERHYPRFDLGAVEGSHRRAMNYDVPPYLQPSPSTYSSLRKAVPADSISNPKLWMLPKLQPKGSDMIPDRPYLQYFTYPSPITPRPGPLRPTRPKLRRPSQTHLTNPTQTTKNKDIPNLPMSIDEEMDSLKNKYNIMDKAELQSSKDNFMKKVKTGPKTNEDDYEEEIKGVPLRKKRDIDHLNRINKNLKSDVKIIKEKENGSGDKVKDTKRSVDDSTSSKTVTSTTIFIDNIEHKMSSSEQNYLNGNGYNHDIKTTNNNIVDNVIIAFPKSSITPYDKFGKSIPNSNPERTIVDNIPTKIDKKNFLKENYFNQNIRSTNYDIVEKQFVTTTELPSNKLSESTRYLNPSSKIFEENLTKSTSINVQKSSSQNLLSLLLSTSLF